MSAHEAYKLLSEEQKSHLLSSGATTGDLIMIIPPGTNYEREQRDREMIINWPSNTSPENLDDGGLDKESAKDSRWWCSIL